MDNQVADQPIQQPPVQENQQPKERIFSQSEVNELVGRVKREAVESYQNRQQQQPQQQQHYKSLSEDDVKRLAAEEVERNRQTWISTAQEQADKDNATRIVEAYYKKIDAGKEKYQDFEAVTKDIDMRLYPNIVQLLAQHVDNSHDVLYELSKSGIKMHQLELLCQHDPVRAIGDAKRLAESIKSNEEAVNSKSAKSPLSQTKSSNSSIDHRSLSIKDLKKLYKV